VGTRATGECFPSRNEEENKKHLFKPINGYDFLGLFSKLIYYITCHTALYQISNFVEEFPSLCIHSIDRMT